ncbi:MAG: hypothetical protein ABJL99_05070 [Aliishimia sp.]
MSPFFGVQRQNGGAGDFYLARGSYEALNMARAVDRKTSRAWRVLWIIDSHMEIRELTAKVLSPFDLIAVTQFEEAARYEKLAPGRVIVVPWGSDVVAMHREPAPMRTTDVLRVGRQPQLFDDDAENAKLFTDAGLSFQGRPAFVSADAYLSQMSRNLRSAKFTMASSNLCDDSAHTDAVKEYVTPRWVDAISAGTIVVGKHPRVAETSPWIEQGLIVDCDISSKEAYVADISAALAKWTPQCAAYNIAYAFEHFDLRLRINAVLQRVGYSGAGLTQALTDLEQAKAANQVQIRAQAC